MKITSSTDMLIEDLIGATYGANTNSRQTFIFKEALLGLVRVAKAEQVLEMRTNLAKLIGDPAMVTGRQRTKYRQRTPENSARWPQQLEFNHFD